MNTIYKPLICYFLLLLFFNLSCTNDTVTDGGSEGDTDVCIENPVDYINDLKPIIDKNCAYSGCHVQGFSSGDFSTYESIDALGYLSGNNRFFERATIIKDMPPSNASGPKELSDSDIEKIKCWHNASYPKGEDSITSTPDTVIVTDTVYIDTTALDTITITDTIEVNGEFKVVEKEVVLVKNDTLSIDTIETLGYCEANPATYDADVKALITLYCTNPGCHPGNGGPGNFSTYQGLSLYISENNGSPSRFENRVILSAGTASSMPPSYSSGDFPIADDDLETLKCWVEAGYPEN